MTMQASIHGRLGKDPREIQTSTGTAMAVAPVAVTVPVVKSENLETVWIDVVCFGRVAELLLRHNSGEMLNAMGSIQVNRWQGQDGETRQGWQLIADSIISARSTRPSGGKNQAQLGQQPRQSSQQRTQQAQPDERNPPPGDDFDDDIPF